MNEEICDMEIYLLIQLVLASSVKVVIKKLGTSTFVDLFQFFPNYM